MLVGVRRCSLCVVSCGMLFVGVWCCSLVVVVCCFVMLVVCSSLFAAVVVW